ncbi:MAG: DNA-directed RNA polymerase subunit P [Nanoarchaeota archaeon]
MAEYKCFSCAKIVGSEYLRKRIRCPYCGSKIIYKPRSNNTIIKAR